MLTNLFIIFCGLALLLGGGTLLIPGTIGLAKRFNIPARIVAFVIVAGGTSAPELLVSVNAVFLDSPGIAWGNVLGSNLANSLLVLGLGALAAPIITSDSLTRWDLKFLFLISLVIFGILASGLYSGLAGIIISLILIFSYFIYLVRMLRVQPSEPEIDEPSEKRSWKTALFYTIGGIAALIFGAELFAKNPDLANPGRVAPMNESLAELASNTHSLMGYVIVIAIVLHIAGAIKHHRVYKDKTLDRMKGKTVS